MVAYCSEEMLEAERAEAAAARDRLACWAAGIDLRNISRIRPETVAAHGGEAALRDRLEAAWRRHLGSD
ncbi:hypothetical protein [Defluviimonas salinarum]|uniref:Uncharacterized protein n=1 Tax=Defluviimonas salinarum TaxID=2992147 RepID=A0ABT3J5F4_9RHOB|nr:hypothetical protein [Defluviimonas salinarum]MCW3782903.1 hypothetical protein [Defluviimonas salinarum]